MSEIRLAAETSPSTPPVGFVTIYAKSSDKRFYGKDETGTEFSLGTIPNTDSLPEGAINLYFTNERAQDAIGAIVNNTATITIVYDDAGNSLYAYVNTGSIDNTHIATSAAIAHTKMAALTASRAMVTNGSGFATTSAATATEVGYLSGVTSGIQAQLDAKPTPEAPTVNCFVYVSQQGNDTTGDGTYNKPFATVTKANSIITDAATGKRYGIHIRGTITETNIYLKPFVWLYGDTWGSSRINATGGNVTLDPTAFASGNSRCGITNVYLTGSTGINLDFVAAGAAGSHVVEMDHLGINGSVTINPNNQNQYFQWMGGGMLFGNLTIHGALGFFDGLSVFGNTTVDQLPAPASTGGVNFKNAFFAGNFTHSSTGSFTNPVQLTYSYIGGTLSVSGSSCVFSGDAVSIPAASQITLSSGGSITRTTEIATSKYAPTTASDWNTVPTQGQQALDTLATSGVAKSQSAASFLASPSGASGLPSFRSIVTADVSDAVVLGRVLTGFTEAYGFSSASDSILQSLQKLSYSSCLQKNVVSTDAVVNDGETWIRANTIVTGTAEVLALGDSEILFI